MASEQKYDFKKNRLSFRLRIMGAVLLFAGVLYAGCAVMLAQIAVSASSRSPQLLSDQLVFGIGAAGICMVALGVFSLILPAKPSLVHIVRILSIILAVICVIVLISGVASKESVSMAFGGIGAAVSGGILPMLHEGKVS